MTEEINIKLEKNIDVIKKRLGFGETFDLLIRDFYIGNKKTALVCFDGFVKDELIYIMRELMEIKREDLSVNVLDKIMKKFLPYYEVEMVETLDDVVRQVLNGTQVLLLEGEKKAVVIDGRSWLSRTPEEPELEKATRGPGDGFVETMLFNVTAVRRRLKDENFRAEIVEIGKRAKNDVALVYINDIINKKMLKEIRDKLQAVNIDGIPLADKSVEEIITGGTLNPLPLVRYTERPDIVAAHILEGHLAIIVDNSPTALLLPAPFLAQVQTLEVYRKGTLIGTYLSLLRWLAVFVSVFLPAIWLLLATNRELVPDFLSFIGPREEISIGLGLQFILASLGIDLIRMASIQTPGTLATSLSLIGALLLGDFAVRVGLFSPEVILYMSVAAIGNFAIPGYELALVLKMVRIAFIVAVIFFDLPGLLVSFLLLVLWLVFTKSFGVYYLWPLIPFNYQGLKSFLITETVLDLSHMRPEAYGVRDKDRAVKEDDSEPEQK